MAGLSKRQRVKVNAALSMIYDHGYEAQSVHDWASEYRREGYPAHKAFERALNEFVAGQPELGAALGKITRLIHHSDDQTVAKYDHALNEFISTGNDAALVALSPMIARDSLTLAVGNGEIAEGSATAESLEAALGFAPAAAFVAVAAQAAPTSDGAQPDDGGSQSREDVTLGARNGVVSTEAQVSPFAGGGRATKQEQWAQTFNTGSPGRARTLLSGHVVGLDIAPSQTTI